MNSTLTDKKADRNEKKIFDPGEESPPFPICYASSASAVTQGTTRGTP